MNLVKQSIENRIGFITLNRPEKRNAFSYDLIDELKIILLEFESNEAIRSIILKAEGDVFSAGADLAYLQDLQKYTFDQNFKDSSHLKELYEIIYNHSKIIIAQIEGHAIAGGCGLASVCDYSFSVPEAKFGYTEVKIGFIPAIVMFFLNRKIGEGKARDLLLRGDLISAQEAKEYGIINGVVNKSDINSHCIAFAEKLNKETSPQSIAITKKMLAKIQEFNMEDALNYAAEMNAYARANEDCKRGIAAFINKEKIDW